MTDEPLIDAAANAIEQRIQHLRATIRVSLTILQPLEALTLLTQLLCETVPRFPATERPGVVNAVCDELGASLGPDKGQQP